MAYWLLKTEPSTFSWDDQVKRGDKGEPWTGVRNFRARGNLKKMQKGDRAFFYHSVEGKEVVGIVEVIREHYQDPTDDTGKWVVVDVKAIKPFPRPVTLAEARADPKLKDMVLVRNARLSVQPVTEDEWNHICALGGVKE
jgi:predicted RNA-binding protein with PUA-like domain